MKFNRLFSGISLLILFSCGQKEKSQRLNDSRLGGDWFLDFSETNEAIARNRGVAPESLTKALFEVFSRSQHIMFDQENGLMIIGSEREDTDTIPYVIEKKGSTFLILEVKGENDFKQELLIRFIGADQDVMWLEAGRFDMKCYRKLPQ